MFLQISQNSQENTCARVSFLTKLKATVCNFVKKQTLTLVYFPVNFAKFLRTHLQQNTSGRLLLKIMATFSKEVVQPNPHKKITSFTNNARIQTKLLQISQYSLKILRAGLSLQKGVTTGAFLKIYQKLLLKKIALILHNH